MAEIDKFLRKPAIIATKEEGKFEKFNLTENPFPATPFVIKDAQDARMNGNIFEMTIRQEEYKQIEDNFLKVSQSDPNHLRLGYIIDTSYVGRGNGKSAFLINLQKAINDDFCLDVSQGNNKCFAIYVTPEPSGRTKIFEKFVDLMFQSLLSSGIIKHCLASLRLEALLQLQPKFDISSNFSSSDAMIESLNSEEWFREKEINHREINEIVQAKEPLNSVPREFPAFQRQVTLFSELPKQEDFSRYYSELKRSKDKLDFVFSYMVDFFRTANFNGAYLLIDDFERIPDFQSARQKRDFALELRSSLYDGLYTNAKIGFYNFFLVFHAGVPRLIQEAWSDSGMENRAPISTQKLSRHIIPFEKLTQEHAKLLLKKYLSEYRIKHGKVDELSPFSEKAVQRIAELAELNAAKILKTAYELLDRASSLTKQKKVDLEFVNSFISEGNIVEERPSQNIASTETTDLIKKARGQE